MCQACEENSTCALARTLFHVGKSYLEYKESKDSKIVRIATDSLHMTAIHLLDAFVKLHHHSDWLLEKQKRYRESLWVFYNGKPTQIGFSHEYGDGFGIVINEDGSWSTHT